jgi:hypothetical protein
MRPDLAILTKKVGRFVNSYEKNVGRFVNSCEKMRPNLAILTKKVGPALPTPQTTTKVPEPTINHDKPTINQRLTITILEIFPQKIIGGRKIFINLSSLGLLPNITTKKLRTYSHSFQETND